MRKKIYGKEIYLEDSVVYDSYVVAEDGVIVSIEKGKPENTTFDYQWDKIFPGLIDIHVHGGNGYDVMDASYRAVNELSKYKLREGVTSFCPTTLTAPMEKTMAAIENINYAVRKGVEGAKIAGMFLEGPYIDKKRRGAHPEDFIREISVQELESLLAVGEKNIRSVAIAPECSGAIDAIRCLTDQGVSVRIGHSSASYEQTIAAVDAGATVAIHTYNAMSSFNHRQVGMVGAVLLDDRIFCEAIVDLIHVDRNAFRLLLKCRGSDKIVLITDCMMAGGLNDGNYKLGELDVTVKAGVARTGDGALAGSTLDMMSAVKNLVSMGISCFDAVKMASIIPARAIGIDQKTGSISVGKQADFICVDSSLNLQKIFIDGQSKDFD